MKVKIGKYPSRLTCNIFSNYMDEKYSYRWPAKKDWGWKERWLEKLEDSIQCVYNKLNRLIFDRREQKIEVRIDDWDTWSMDTTLAHIILPMLLQLKEQKHGAPNVDCNDVPDYLKTTQEEIAAYNRDGTTDDRFFERWDYVLDCMIFSFQSILDDSWKDLLQEGTPDIKFIAMDRQGEVCSEDEALVYRMEKTDKDTYKVDYEGMKEYEERIQEGLRLFGKYYRSLWT
ncbi:hypothetical protein M316_0048 [Nitrincola phage 1M3-16]|uniref:hypothetical protein n=1 Tax=Nitrincola phage 1M3-16 TaxID=1472912 RepID=UPI000444BE51|nr:hypothetical protein GJ22_gp104 [Nitrincola phage 1M3-16]AHX01113.1 hypothetical protein M316_0048 [Nitrincola phage 1M3-16]